MRNIFDAIESRLAKSKLPKSPTVHLWGTDWLAPMLLGLLVAAVLYSQPSRAAVVTFEASNESAPPANPVAVAITVANFTDVFGFSLSLQWDPNVIQFGSIGTLADLPGFSTGNFNTSQTSVGRLGVLWDDTDFSGNSLANGSLLFGVNFTAIGAAGTFTTLSFGDTPTARDVVVIAGGTPMQATFAGVDGSVTVVPEPINVALGLFVAIFVGTLTVRRISGWRNPAVS